MARKFLIVLTAFLAITAILGGLALAGGLLKPPVEMLRGMFGGDYLFPGLALMLLVGEPAANSVYFLIKNQLKRARIWSQIAAAAIIIFEIVEIAVIGSPPGPSQVMQIFYLALGAVIFFYSFKLQESGNAEIL